MSRQKGIGRHELLAELIEAADAMHDGVISEVGLSLVRGCLTTWNKEFEEVENALKESTTQE